MWRIITMTESYTFEELISGYFDNEFANIEEVAPRFSIKHKIAMRKIFRIFADNAYNKSSTNQAVYVPSKPISIRKRLIIAAIIIVGMAVLTGFVIMFISNGFKGKVYHDNTHLVAVNTEDCPTNIEKEYELSVLPKGYTLSKSTNGSFYCKKVYRNKDNQDLTFIQYVKSKFNLHINTEGYEPVETVINGHNAIYIDFDNQEVILVWDSNDYILEISGIFNKYELLKLVELNENAGF